MGNQNSKLNDEKDGLKIGNYIDVGNICGYNTDYKWKTMKIIDVKKANHSFPFLQTVCISVKHKYSGEDRKKLKAITVKHDSDDTPKQLIFIEYDTICICLDDCNNYRHKICKANTQLRWQNEMNNILLASNNVFDNILMKELKFYKKMVQFWTKLNNNQTNRLISTYSRKYNKIMLNIAQFIKLNGLYGNQNCNHFIFDKYFYNNSNLDINFIYFWRLHMFHPNIYKNDCIHHFGFILSSPFHDYLLNGKIINSDDDHDDRININNNDELFTKIEFNKIFSKNLIFMRNVLSLNEISDDIDFCKYISDYKDYLYYASYFNRYDIHLSPTFEQHFAWHSHMIFPKIYSKESTQCTVNNTVLNHVQSQCTADHLDDNVFSNRFWTFIEEWYFRITSPDHPRFKQTILQKIVNYVQDMEKNKLLLSGFLSQIVKSSNYKYEIQQIADLCSKYLLVEQNWIIDDYELSATPPPSPSPSWQPRKYSEHQHRFFYTH